MSGHASRSKVDKDNEVSIWMFLLVVMVVLCKAHQANKRP